jgi:glycine/D-amino acid oxidase-like deaminating enzyme
VLVEGFYDLTPDGLAVVGPLPGHDGLWIAAGHGGRGFMMAPAVGRALANAVAGHPDAVPDPLSPARFEHDVLSSEPQVV